jgi:hypothetical protein
MRQNQFDLSVLVHGKPIREYEGPDGRIFVEGREGSEFTLRLRNFTPNRVLAVLTVDGLSVIDGKPGDYKESGGYVIAANSYVDIPGWRLDNNEVAKFIFDAIADSYSVEAGKGKKNVGVIGAAIFLEKQVQWHGTYTYPWNNVTYTVTSDSGNTWHSSDTLYGCKGITPPDSNSCFCCSTMNVSGDVTLSAHNAVMDKPAAAKPKDSQQIGTGFGKAASHRVVDVDFEKASESPWSTISLYYDSYERLKSAGVIRQKHVEVCRTPSPFPKNDKGCRPPANWKR